MSVKPVTIVQLAHSLNISPATVSNAYHHPERLSSALRQKIFDAADRLGFSGPNPSASSLRTGRIHVIGVLYHDQLSFAFTDPGYILFLQGAAQVLELAGVAITLLPGVRTIEQASVRIRQSPADGYIIYSMSPRDPMVEKIQLSGEPLVYIDQGGSTSGFVGIQDQIGARLAAGHLVELGHRKIGIASLGLSIWGSGSIASPARIRSCSMPMALARLKGYREGLRQPLGSAKVPVYECKENMLEEGRQAFQRLIEVQPNISAIIAMTDLLAAGVMEEAIKQGLKVPADLSVVGFDDVPLAATIDPPLTTVRQPHIEKGRAAAKMLLEQIETGTTRKRKIFSVKLVVRKSTGKARLP